MSRQRYFKGIKAIAIVVAIISVLIILSKDQGSLIETPGDYILSFLMLASGPIQGWIIAFLNGEVAATLWSLIPLTVLSFGSLYLAAKQPKRQVGYLIVGGIFWLLSSFYYGVAIWI